MPSRQDGPSFCTCEKHLLNDGLPCCVHVLATILEYGQKLGYNILDIVPEKYTAKLWRSHVLFHGWGYAAKTRARLITSFHAGYQVGQKCANIILLLQA